MILLQLAVLLAVLSRFIPLMALIYLRERDGDTRGVRDAAALFKHRDRRSARDGDPPSEVEG